jgi:hypothetical protein
MQQEQSSQMAGNTQRSQPNASRTLGTSRSHTAAGATTPAENRRNTLTQHHHPHSTRITAANRKPDGMEHQTLAGSFPRNQTTKLNTTIHLD